MPAVTDIYWNHLKLSIPASWETIVKKPRHLILEHNLTPFLEIRWQQPGKHTSRKQSKAILKQFNQPPSSSSEQQERQVLPDFLSKRYDVTVLENKQHSIPSRLLTCRECGTTILVGLHRKSFDWLIQNTSVFESLICLHENKETEYWQIQDFFFTIPSGFELDSCSFQFGISDLIFKNKQADLRICRLAPASEHMKQHGFSELFASFCSAPLESIQVVDERTVHYHKVPTMLERFWQRIRKKRSFTQASFNHFPDDNRILGYMVAGNHPPAVDWGTQLENGYGIIQETTEETGYNP